MKKIFVNRTANLKQTRNKYLLTGIFCLIGLFSFAQKAEEKIDYESVTLLSNPLFIGLSTIIVLLIIIIGVLAGVLANVAGADKQRKKNNKIIATILLVVLLSYNKETFAQSFFSVSEYSNYMGLSSGLFYLMISFIIFEIVIFLTLLNSIRLFTEKEE